MRLLTSVRALARKLFKLQTSFDCVLMLLFIMPLKMSWMIS